MSTGLMSNLPKTMRMGARLSYDERSMRRSFPEKARLTSPSDTVRRKGVDWVDDCVDIDRSRDAQTQFTPKPPRTIDGKTPPSSPH
jgi:hypothetical protein